MRSFDKPLPGDLVTRRQQDASRLRAADVWIITHWPDPDTVVAGPYQSFPYALQQARRLGRDRSLQIWRDHARPGHPEQLEHVAET
jgi:hypothetical protein